MSRDQEQGTVQLQEEVDLELIREREAAILQIEVFIPVQVPLPYHQTWLDLNYCSIYQPMTSKVA
jgi:hypothetical protein